MLSFVVLFDRVILIIGNIINYYLKTKITNLTWTKSTITQRYKCYLRRTYENNT